MNKNLLISTLLFFITVAWKLNFQPSISIAEESIKTDSTLTNAIQIDSTTIDTSKVVQDTLLKKIIIKPEYSVLIDTLPGVIIISSEQIRETSAIDLPDFLESVVGMRVDRYGGLGQGGFAKHLGATPQQMTFLLNGRKLKEPISGEFNLSDIHLKDIERIEIIPFGIGVQFSPHSIGTVINIITKYKKSESPPISILDTVQGESDAQLYNIHFGKKLWLGTDIFLFVGSNNTKGFTVNSEYKDKVLGARLDYTSKFDKILPSRWLLSFAIRRQSADIKIPPFGTGIEEERKINSIEGGLIGNIGKVNLRGHIYQTFTEHSYNINYGLQQGNLFGGLLSSNIKLIESIVINTGVELEQRKIESPIYEKSSQYSYWIQGLFKHSNKFRGLAGINYVSNSTYNDNVICPSLYLAYKPFKDNYIFAGANKGVRFPSFKEESTDYIYYNLKYEEGTNYEIGIKNETGRKFHYSTSGFYRTVDNQIAVVESPLAPLNKGGIQGEYTGLKLELISRPIKRADIGVNYTYITSKFDNDKSLPYLPQNLINGYFQFGIWKAKNSDLRIRFDGKYSAECYIDYNESEKLNDYVIINGKLTVRILKAVIFLSVNNIANTKYYNIAGYEMPRSKLLWGVNWELEN